MKHHEWVRKEIETLEKAGVIELSLSPWASPCYVSSQFRGSQQNWAALTKEAYAIYMAIRKLSFYITDAEVTIKCDHLPLKKFLQKQTLNAKVNNWAVELEQFNLKLEWIQGIKNTLADSLLRLLEVDPEAKLQPEKKGHEFGTFCFE